VTVASVSRCGVGDWSRRKEKTDGKIEALIGFGDEQSWARPARLRQTSNGRTRVGCRTLKYQSSVVGWRCSQYARHNVTSLGLVVSSLSQKRSDCSWKAN
jgi:hypothetical protein